MPLKREALPLVDRLTDRARLAGAVNTLVLERRRRPGSATTPTCPGRSPPSVSARRPRWRRRRSSAAVRRPPRSGWRWPTSACARSSCAVREEARATETLAALRAHPSAPEVVGVLTTGAPEPAGSDVDVVSRRSRRGAQTPELVAGCADVPVVFEVLYDPWPTPLVDRGGGPDARRRPGPARAPGGAAVRAVHRPDGRGRRDARSRRTRPGGAQCRLNDPVTDTLTALRSPRSSRPCSPGWAACWCPRLIARVPGARAEAGGGGRATGRRAPQDALRRHRRPPGSRVAQRAAVGRWRGRCSARPPGSTGRCCGWCR